MTDAHRTTDRMTRCRCGSDGSPYAPCVCGAEAKRHQCEASMSADPPRDCNAPFCGCNPEWQKVIGALVECGWKSPEELHNGTYPHASDEDAYQAHATAPATIEEWRGGGVALRLAFMAGVRHGRATPTPPEPSAEPIATLHDDGHWTWTAHAPESMKHPSNYAGWRLPVFARAPEPRGDDLETAAIHLMQEVEQVGHNYYGADCHICRAIQTVKNLRTAPTKPEKCQACNGTGDSRGILHEPGAAWNVSDFGCKACNATGSPLNGSGVE